MTSSLLLALLFNAVLAAICGYAMVRGGRPERIGAAVNLIASAATTALRLASPRFYAPAEILILSIDASVVAGFFWLGISTTRFWPIWAFGFAVADVVISVTGGMLPKTPLFAYHTSLGIYAYLALASLALGTFRLPRNAPAHVRAGRRTPPASPPIDKSHSE